MTAASARSSRRDRELDRPARSDAPTDAAGPRRGDAARSDRAASQAPGHSPGRAASCSRAWARLTQIRRQVLEGLYEPIGAGAYDLAERSPRRTGRRSRPITVYRALEFLLEQACPPPRHPQRLCGLPASGRRRGVALPASATNAAASARPRPRASTLRSPASSRKAGFAPREQIVEIAGLCAALPGGASWTGSGLDARCRRGQLACPIGYRTRGVTSAWRATLPWMIAGRVTNGQRPERSNSIDHRPRCSRHDPVRTDPLARHMTTKVQRRRRHGGRRRAHRRPVDDQHRHRGHRRDGEAGRGAGARRLRARAHHRRPRRGGRRRAAYPRPAARASASTCRSIGDFHYIGHKLLAEHPACAEALGEVSHQPRQCRLQARSVTASSA